MAALRLIIQLILSGDLIAHTDSQLDDALRIIAKDE